MKTIKRIFSFVPPFVLWLMLCVLVWGFVFTRITDAAPADKLLICVDTQAPGGTQLASYLEERLPDTLRMVQVRPFTYAMFDGDALRGADLFIVKASHAEAYREWFSPLPESLRSEENILSLDGVPLGILSYDAAAGKGVAGPYIQYAVPGEEAEDYYLFFGGTSLHNAEMENAVDDLAADAARLLLAME